MADAFDAATTKIDQSRLALLTAIRQAGTAGKAAYEAGQADLAAQRQSAVAAALAAAGGRGAPEALSGQLSQTVAQPYDRARASLTAGLASRQGDLAARQANSESYLGEVAAAVPITRAAAERQLAELRARAGGAAGASALGRDRLALDREKFEYEKGKGQGGADLSDSELNNRLLGVAEIQKEQAAAKPAALSKAGFGVKSLNSWLNDRPNEAVRRSAVETLARNAGVAAGIDPARVYGVVPPAKAAVPAGPQAALAKKIGVADLGTIRRSAAYQAGVEAVNVGLQGGMSLNDFKRFINADPQFANQPKTVALILEEFGRRFPSSQPQA